MKKIIKIAGLSELQVKQTIADIITLHDKKVEISILEQDNEIHLSLKTVMENGQQHTLIFNNIIKEIIDRLQDNVFGFDKDTLVIRCGELLRKSKKQISLAESCTGGLLAKMLTDIPNSSDYFWGSVCTYNNQAKSLLLGVKENSLEKYGAVSKEIAIEMAQGVLSHYPVDMAVSITGIAGPQGGLSSKPVGLVYICVAEKDFSQVREFNFYGNRAEVRLHAAKSALDLLRRRLEGKIL